MVRFTGITSFALVAALSAPLAAQQPQKPQPKPAASAASSIPAIIKSPAQASKPAMTVREAQPGLLKKAKVTPEAALVGMTGAKILSARIEEHGKDLTYQFRVDMAGKVHDVGVDTHTGRRLAAPVKHQPLRKPWAAPGSRGRSSASNPGKQSGGLVTLGGLEAFLHGCGTNPPDRSASGRAYPW